MPGSSGTLGGDGDERHGCGGQSGALGNDGTDPLAACEKQNSSHVRFVCASCHLSGPHYGPMLA